MAYNLSQNKRALVWLSGGHFINDIYTGILNPIMPFIAELRDFKEKNPCEYERLLNIQNLALTRTTNPLQKAFGSLHEINAKNELVQSYLYITSSEEKKAHKMEQLEFFEMLKPLSALDASGELGSEWEQFESNILTRFKAEKQNASQTRKQANKEGINNENDAYNKMQSLTEIEDFEDEVYDLIDDICDAITNGNRTVIKQVNKATLKDEGLGHIILTEEIKNIWKYTNLKNKDSVPQVKIIFVD